MNRQIPPTTKSPRHRSSESSQSTDGTLSRLEKLTAEKSQQQISLATDDTNDFTLYLRSAVIPAESDPLLYWSLKKESSPQLCAVISY